MTDDELYRRGAKTVVASWEAYAAGADGASLQRAPGVVAAVFPHGAESRVYNNALFDRDLPDTPRRTALDAAEAMYAAAGVGRFAVWTHETDSSLHAELERRGYTLDETTRAMGMPLDDLPLPRPQVDLGPPDWAEHVRFLDMPPDFLAGADHAAFHVVVARADGENVATALAFDHDGDCALANVGTLEHARRRGLGTALTALQLHDARARGCRTASLHSTPIAEGVYATAGFRDLGRILEYVPGDSPL